jgi:glycosyltransferase involved in cell wall biosynthesis
MRVLLIANFPPDLQHSMLRYADLLEAGLLAAGVEVTRVAPQARLSRLTNKGGRVWKWLAYADKYVGFAFELSRVIRRFQQDGPGVIHLLDQGNAVLTPLFLRWPHVVTCHDWIAIKAGSGRSWYQRWNAGSLRRARWLACVSEATRQEAMIRMGVPADRCCVIHNPLPPFFGAPAGPRPDGLPPAYLLHVGSGSFYKNRPGLLRIYAALCGQGCDLPLVLMGEPLRPEEAALAGRLGVRDRLQERAHPDDTEIRAAYAHAAALIFPSIEEGFGWPVLEAMAQGCLVFTTGRPPMTEVGGEVAVYLDPDHPRDCARQILAVLGDAEDGQRRKRQGRARAAEFSLEKFTREWCILYERVLRETTVVPA